MSSMAGSAFSSRLPLPSELNAAWYAYMPAERTCITNESRGTTGSSSSNTLALKRRMGRQAAAEATARAETCCVSSMAGSASTLRRPVPPSELNAAWYTYVPAGWDLQRESNHGGTRGGSSSSNALALKQRAGRKAAVAATAAVEKWLRVLNDRLRLHLAAASTTLRAKGSMAYAHAGRTGLAS